MTADGTIIIAALGAAKAMARQVLAYVAPGKPLRRLALNFLEQVDEAKAAVERLEQGPK